MRKALLVSTVSRQFTLFDKDNIRILKELGYEVHCAANFEDATPDLDSLGIVRHHFDIQRSPYSFKNIKAFFQLLRIMKTERFDLVHCHAPMGGLLGRLCAQLTGTRPVLYTAHGFHFYKGAPLVNNLLYKTIEMIAARWTDGLITINSEDYTAAKSFKLRNKGEVYLIPGVGVDTEEISTTEINKVEKRKEIGVPADAFLIVSVGELNKNKNHKQVIEAINILTEDIKQHVYYVICGVGKEKANLEKLIDHYNLKGRTKILGYRSDIKEILKCADLFAFTSYREGLSKSLMESMAAGLPVIATRIRGNIDLIENEKNGILVDCEDIESTALAIERIYRSEKLRNHFSSNNIRKIKNYDIKIVNHAMRDIYKVYLWC